MSLVKIKNMKFRSDIQWNDGVQNYRWLGKRLSVSGFGIRNRLPTTKKFIVEYIQIKISHGSSSWNFSMLTSEISTLPDEAPREGNEFNQWEPGTLLAITHLLLNNRGELKQRTLYVRHEHSQGEFQTVTVATMKSLEIENISQFNRLLFTSLPSFLCSFWYFIWKLVDKSDFH